MKLSRVSFLVSVMFVLALLLSALSCFSVVATETESTWADVAADSANAIVAVDNTYTITTAEQLAWIAGQVNTGVSFSGMTVLLANNIELTTANVSTICNWVPIGSSSFSFSGTFDGQNHTISGLHINTDATHQGLFGVLGEYAVVQNVGVINTTITAGSYVGAIAGSMAATGTIKNVYSDATIVATGLEVYAGGLVGMSGGTASYPSYIQNSYFTGSVDATAQATTVYVGGIAGQSTAYIQNCYNAGTISCSGGATTALMGGIVGNRNNSNIAVSDCYFLDTSCQYGIGNEPSSTMTTALTETEMTDGTLLEKLNTWVNSQSAGGFTTWLDGGLPCFTIATVHSHSWDCVNTGSCLTYSCDCGDTKSISITAVDGVYTGEPVTATVTTDNWTDDLTIVYSKTDDADFTGMPIDAGSYTARVTVDDQTISASYSVAKAKVTLTPTAGSSYYGEAIDLTDITVTCAITPPAITGSLALTDSATAVGDYTIGLGTIALADSDNFELVFTEDVSYQILAYQPDAVVTANDAWQNADSITLTPPDGFSISANGIAYADSLTTLARSTATGTVTYYLKNVSTGAISVAQNYSYKNDQIAPTGSISVSDRLFDKLLSIITFGWFSNKVETVSITAEDDLSGVASVWYCVCDAQTEVDSMEWFAYEDEISLQDRGLAVVYAKIIDEVGNTTYLSTDGMVLYDNSSSTVTAVTYTKESAENIVVPISFASNSFSAIYLNDTVLDVDDYCVEDTQITVDSAVFESLEAGNYRLIVTFDPQGIAFDSTSAGDVPTDVEIAVTVHSHSWDCVNMGSGLTYSCDCGDTKSISITAVDEVYTGEPVTATVTTDNWTDDLTIVYSKTDDADFTGMPTDAGSYTASVTVADQTISVSYQILAYQPDAVVAANDAWQNADSITLTPPDGFTISANGIVFADSLTILARSTATGTVTYYLKNVSTGAISVAQNYSYKNDQIAPTGSISVSDRLFDKLLSIITFGWFSNKVETVSIATEDDLSGVASVWYCVCDAQTEVDSMEWIAYDDEISLQDRGLAVVYAKIIDEVGNTTYLSTDGMVLYDNSSSTATAVTYTKESAENIVVPISFSDNSFSAIYLNDTALDEDDYCVEDTQITVDSAVFESLEAGNYRLIVTFDPQGIAFDSTSAGDVPTDVEIAVTVLDAPIVVAMIEGEEQVIADEEPAEFRSNAAFADFETVLLDGVELDPSCYEVSEGSTIVTLTTAFIKTLANSQYTLSIVSSVGVAEATFTVANVTTNTGATEETSSDDESVDVNDEANDDANDDASDDATEVVSDDATDAVRVVGVTTGDGSESWILLSFVMAGTMLGWMLSKKHSAWHA